MEFALLFAVGWLAKHVFAEKRDEYAAAQEVHRDKYLKKLTDNHPSWNRTRKEKYLRNAAGRNAAGHLAYLLRHGWSSTFRDVGDGWRNAKSAHEEWKADRREDGAKAGRWQTLKAGWYDRKRRWEVAAEERKARGAYLPPEPEPTSEPIPDPTAEPTEPTEPPTGPWLDDGEARDAKIYSWPSDTTMQTPDPTDNSTTNGSTTMSTEFNFDASKNIIANIAQQLLGPASQLEQIEADAIVGGLTADTEAMSILTSLQEAIRNAVALSNAYVANANKHASGQEYANSGHAANTDYLRSS